jgi:hypothetical protein
LIELEDFLLTGIPGRSEVEICGFFVQVLTICRIGSHPNQTRVHLFTKGTPIRGVN